MEDAKKLLFWRSSCQLKEDLPVMLPTRAKLYSLTARSYKLVDRVSSDVIGETNSHEAKSKNRVLCGHRDGHPKELLCKRVYQISPPWSRSQQQARYHHYPSQAVVKPWANQPEKSLEDFKTGG